MHHWMQHHMQQSCSVHPPHYSLYLSTLEMLRGMLRVTVLGWTRGATTELPRDSCVCRVAHNADAADQ